MMALGDVLAARAKTARATARVACGSLGEVTLEALSVRELEQLSGGEDADRAIFYAACRDLQRVGAELLRQGKVYRPDQVTELVSADEANIAAQAVRELSAYQGGQDSRESADMRLRAQEADAATASPAAGAKDVLSFRGNARSAACGGCSEGISRQRPAWRAQSAREAAGATVGKKVHPLNPERKGVSTDLGVRAVDDRKSWVRDDTEAATPTADADARVDGGVPEGNEATPTAGAGARVDESVPEGSSASADAGDEAKEILSFPEKKVSLWTPERKGSGADLGVRAVDDRKSWVLDDTFSEGDRWRYREGERSAPEGDEVGEDGAQVFSEERGQVVDAVAVERAGKADAATAEDGQDADAGAGERVMSEVRPESVQEIAEVRHDTVQQVLTENTKIRHSFVQVGEEGFKGGQVSREFLTEKTDEPAKSEKEQVLWSEVGQTPQNVVEMDKMDSGLRNNKPVADNKPALRKRKKPNRAHETTSEFEIETGSGLHEDTSESTVGEVRILHEMTSEIAETMHESKSESGKMMHESESDFVENVHESKSEKRETLHETESEIAQRVAREMLEGLRRAAWVR